MRVIGLTGGIATGKSTVSNFLLSLNLPVIDADLIAREVVEPGSQGLQQLVENFGPEVLTSQGALDRPILAQKLFNDEAVREQVNAILHPLIAQTMLGRIEDHRSQGATLVFLDIPLLFETQELSLFDDIWLVYIPAELQLDRLMKRDQLTLQAAEARIASQFPIEEKRALADVIIDNSASFDATKQQVLSLLEALNETN